MTSGSNVSPWVNHWSHLQPAEGDLIEFDRRLLTGFFKNLPIGYCHWAVYIGSGRIVHFNPKGNEFAGLSGLEKFSPAEVTYANLGEVAGDSRIRVNNKPEVGAKRRSLDHMRGTWKILVNKPGYTYNLQTFNCEHFATYVKFEGISICAQDSWLMTKAYEQVAYFQWWLSAFCVARGKPAPEVLITYINFWEGPNSTTDKWKQRYLDIVNQCEAWNDLPILQLKK